MRNVNYNDSTQKNNVYKLNQSEYIEEHKTFNKRINKNEMNEYFLSSKLFTINSPNNSHRNLLSKSTNDKPKLQSSLRNITDIKKTIDDNFFLKMKKIVPLKNIEINKKITQSQSKKKNIVQNLTNKNLTLSLPRIAMKSIQIIPQPMNETITMKNLKLYGEIRNLHKRLTDYKIYNKYE
jgi:hypothetical protein